MTIKSVVYSIDNMTVKGILDEKFRNDMLDIKVSLSNSDKILLSKKLAEFKNHPVDHTLKIILLFSVWDPDLTIEYARKKGVFRYNAWGFQENCVVYLLNEIISNINYFNFSNDTIVYLKTKKELSWLFDYYKETEFKFLTIIKKRYSNRIKFKHDGLLYEESFFKELLVFADLIFNGDRWNTDSNRKDDLYNFGMEEIAEGVSYLIYLCNSTIHTNKITIPFVDPNFVKSKDIERLILESCKACQMKEWELCIDYFNYKVQKTGHVLSIFCENKLFEKSIRLGYVKSIMQSQIFLESKENKLSDVAGLTELSNLINENGIAGITPVGLGILSRFKFNIPEIFFEKLYSFDGFLFKEEMFEVGHFAREIIMPANVLLDKKITENCTIKDIMIFKRFFVFLNMIVVKELYNTRKENKIIASLIPGFNEENLISRIGNYMGSQLKAKELIEFFTYNPNYKLDLQYTPFLRYDDVLLVPTSIVAKSNFMRNCIAYSYLKSNQIVNQDDKECLVLECEKIFKSSDYDYQIFTNKKYKYSNQEGEIDALVVTESSIFIIECKSPLEPTNNYEMRASYDHIQKASKQLSNSKMAFSDKSFAKKYLKSLGVEYKNRNIYTCIVMGNRLFNGFSVDKHPIRYIHELDMILNTGKINSIVGTWNVWRSEKHDEIDLIDFLSDENNLANANFDSMEKHKLVMHIKGKRVEFETFVFNSFSAIQKYDQYFKIESRNDLKYNEIKSMVESN